MWVCLTVLSRPYDMAVFSLGTVLLSTDYKLLRTVRLDPVYQFVTAPDTIRTVQHQYERKRFDERGPDKIPLDPKGNGDFRGVVAQRVESVHEGLRFRVNVKTEIDMETPPGIKKYHLRLGTVRVTNVSETDDADGGVVVFFSISEWRQENEDSSEREVLKEVRENLKQGKCSRELFAKVDDTGPINRFTLDQWRAIFQWV